MTTEKKEAILRKVDHTLLKPTATSAQIDQLCAEAAEFHCAAVCIPPFYVPYVHEKWGGKVKICTAIGFPLGYNSTKVKVLETADALASGADEIDMVINNCLVKNADWDAVEKDIAAVRKAAGDKILKVIIETCYLSVEEKIMMCKIVASAGADFIKTSTGFGTGGAVLEDIDLFKANIGPAVKIKAAGGMKTAADHEAFYDRGCDRLGSSSAIKALAGD